MGVGGGWGGLQNGRMKVSFLLLYGKGEEGGHKMFRSNFRTVL